MFTPTVLHRETSLWGKKLPPDEQAALDLELAKEEAKDFDGKPKQEASSIGVRSPLSCCLWMGLNAPTLLLMLFGVAVAGVLLLLLLIVSFEGLQQNEELLHHAALFLRETCRNFSSGRRATVTVVAPGISFRVLALRRAVYSLIINGFCLVFPTDEAGKPIASITYTGTRAAHGPGQTSRVGSGRVGSPTPTPTR